MGTFVGVGVGAGAIIGCGVEVGSGQEVTGAIVGEMPEVASGVALEVTVNSVTPNALEKVAGAEVTGCLAGSIICPEAPLFGPAKAVGIGGRSEALEWNSGAPP